MINDSGKEGIVQGKTNTQMIRIFDFFVEFTVISPVSGEITAREGPGQAWRSQPAPEPGAR
jgi:hypothetical protein